MKDGKRNRLFGVFISRNVLLIFFIGLLVRILIMPWAMHADLLSMYWRANLMVSHGIMVPIGGQYLGHVVYAVNLIMMKALGFNLTQLFPIADYGLHVGSITASVGDWLRFNELTNVNEVLFWLKLPHLLADVTIFWLIVKYVATGKNQQKALMLWWFNPVNLYAFYVFSRHDAITLLLVLMAVLFAVRNKLAVSLLALFGAVQVRVQPLMYIPLLLVHFIRARENWWTFLVKLIIFASVICGYQLITRVLPVNELVYNTIFETIETSSSTGVSLGGIPSIFVKRGIGAFLLSLPLFTLTYFVTLVLYWYAFSNSINEQLRRLNLAFMLVISTYFALSSFSPHYFVWLSLFPVIAVVFDRHYLRWYLLAIIGWLVSGLITEGAHSINQNLFLPLSPTLFGTPQLHQLVPESRLLYTLSQGLMRLSLGVIVLLALNQLFRNSILKRHMTRMRQVIPVVVIGYYIIFSAPSVHAALLPLLDVPKMDQEINLSENVVGQNFISPEDTFGAVQLKFNTYKESAKKASLVFRIKELGSEQWLYEIERDPADFYNKAFYPFGFPLILNATGKEYYFEVELAEPTTRKLAIMVNQNGYPHGSAFVNGVQLATTDLAFRVDTNKPLTAVISKIRDDVLGKVAEQSQFFTGYILLIMAVLALVPLSWWYYRSDQ